MSCYTRFLHPLATPACYNHSSFTRFHNIFLQSVSGILDDGTAAGKKHLRRLQTGRLRRAPEWARLPAACCFRVPNLCDGIPGRFVILPLSVEGSLLRPEPSMILAPSMEGSAILYRTFHDMDLQRGRFASET